MSNKINNPNNASALRIVLVVFFTLGLGVLIAHLSIPFLFKVLPSDFKRTGLILSTLKSDEFKPKIILFGNSILMNGIDARRVSKNINHQQVVNLSSTGQSLSESFLFYELVPASTKTVVQLVTVEDLVGEESFRKNTANNFILYGYSPPQWTIDNLAKIFGPKSASLLEKPYHEVCFEGRWIVTNFINNSFRKGLRSDLSLDHLDTELYYPNTYRHKISKESLKGLIKNQNPKSPVVDFQFHKKKLSALLAVAKRYKEKNIAYKIIIAPVHPALNNYTPMFFESLRKNYKLLDSMGIQVIDFSTMLTEDSFIDHCHPTPEGAKILSDSLASNLKN